VRQNYVATCRENVQNFANICIFCNMVKWHFVSFPFILLYCTFREVSVIMDLLYPPSVSLERSPDSQVILPVSSTLDYISSTLGLFFIHSRLYTLGFISATIGYYTYHSKDYISSTLSCTSSIQDYFSFKLGYFSSTL
jgi:hypothetical protein